MRLVKNGDVFETDEEAWIVAYKQNGYVEEAEQVEKPKKKPSTRKTADK